MVFIFTYTLSFVVKQKPHVQSTFVNEDPGLTFSAFVSYVIAKHDIGILDNDVFISNIACKKRTAQAFVPNI